MDSFALIAGVCLALAASSQVVAASGPLTIENKSVSASYDPALGTLKLTDAASKRVFVTEGRFQAGKGSAAVKSVSSKQLGKGKSIVIARPDGASDSVTVYPTLPFVLIRSTLANRQSDPQVINHLKTISFRLDVGKQASDLKAFGTAGLTAADGHPGSYAFLALVDPQSRRGVVSGWITQDRGSGVLFSSVNDGSLLLEPQIDYGRLRIKPGATAETETLAIGFFDDARLGLEAYADAVAKFYDIKLPPRPAGYCTWYSDGVGRACNEKAIVDLAKAAQKLKPYGFGYVQIDDGWQEGGKHNGPTKDFRTHDPKGPYPSGMKATADALSNLGFTPGIWFMPFAGDYADPMYKDCQDWFVKHEDGKPYDTDWGGTCLDMTYEPVRAELASRVSRIAHDWGYKFFKMDGLWTGTGTRQIYVNEGYRDDAIGESVFHDPDKTNIEAYRDGLKIVRKSAGKDVFFLGCCAPQNMRSFGGTFGLVDAMRVGPDNHAAWPAMSVGPKSGSRYYFLNGRVWYNDPDAVYVRNSITLDDARMLCSWAAISGQLLADSDWLPNISDDRFEVLKRTLAWHGLKPRPVDLFESSIPRIWLLTDSGKNGRRDVIAFYNWDAASADFDVTAEPVGLPKSDRYVGFDFWENKLVQPFSDSIRTTLAGHSCRIMAVRPLTRNPQVISTSRHVSQGMIDLSAEKWDAATSTLTGKSKVIGSDPYELRVVTLTASDISWKAASAAVSAADQAAGVRVKLTNEDELARVTIESPADREVSWSVKFSKG